MKTRIGLFLILLLLLAGCAAPEALTQNLWQRTEYLSEETTAEFLAALDLTEEEIAMADRTGLGLVWQAEFTAEGTYRFSIDGEATRRHARGYLDTLFTAQSADTAALAAMYGCETYEELLDHLSGALFDYEALGAVEESGSYAVRGKKIFLTGPEGTDRGYIAYALTEDGLTLQYDSKTEEYTKKA